MKKKDNNSKNINTVFDIKIDENILASHAKQNFKIDLDLKKEQPKKAAFYAKMSVEDFEELQKIFLSELKELKNVITFSEFLRLKILEFSINSPIDIFENLPKRVSSGHNGFEITTKRVEMNKNLKDYIDSYIYYKVKETGNFTAVKFMTDLTNYLKSKKHKTKK